MPDRQTATALSSDICNCEAFANIKLAGAASSAILPRLAAGARYAISLIVQPFAVVLALPARLPHDPPRRPEDPPMTESDAVLTANLEFYRAFAMRDIAAMERIWARQATVLCTHPGWLPLSGRPAVMGSWRAILANPDSPRVACHDDTAFVYGTIAVVLCEEDLPGGQLAASNVFIKEEGAWRLLHHHAGPILMREAPVTRH